MKRLIGFGLVLGLGVSGALAACGGSSSSDTGGTGGTAGSGGATGGSGGATGGSGGATGGSGGATGGSGGATGGSGGATGGTGGATGGTGGATGGSGGATGGTGGGTVVCGTEGCNSYNIYGFVIPACCPDGIPDKCGVDVTQAEQFIGITGCVEENAPGDVDSSCPAYSPFTGFTFPGCCLPTGVCGNVVDTAGFGGPNMGCVDVNGLTDGGAPQSCGS